VIDGARRNKLIRGNAYLRNDPMNGIIVGIKPLDFDSICPQQSDFRIHDGILSAVLLISVVNHQYFHTTL
jgi:hypothetical protein